MTVYVKVFMLLQTLMHEEVVYVVGKEATILCQASHGNGGREEGVAVVKERDSDHN